MARRELRGPSGNPENPYTVDTTGNPGNPSVYNDEAPSNPLTYIRPTLPPVPPPPPPAAAPRAPVLPPRRPRALPGWTLESSSNRMTGTQVTQVSPRNRYMIDTKNATTRLLDREDEWSFSEDE